MSLPFTPGLDLKRCSKKKEELYLSSSYTNNLRLHKVIHEQPNSAILSSLQLQLALMVEVKYKIIKVGIITKIYSYLPP